MKHLKSWSIILLSLGLTVSMTACGTGSTAGTQSAPAETESVSASTDDTTRDSSDAQESGTEKPADAANALSLKDSPVRHELEFGGAYTGSTIDEFNAMGFEYGDSVRAEFSNGYVLEDIPYYSGYYTKIGGPLLVAYPGYEAVKLCVNNGDDLWDTAGLSDGDTVTITLNEHGKYLPTQEARDIRYEDDRELYESDVIFANFRSMAGGRLKKNILYRSASPCDNQHCRAPYVDKLISEAGIQYILDLADTDEKIRNYTAAEDFNSPYFLSLYESGKVLPLGLSANYTSKEFHEKVAQAFTAIADNDGPYLIHCTEGKDRTGFVCMLAEALCGASYDEIVDDYMATYANYYGIMETSDGAKYSLIVTDVLDPMIEAVTDEPGVDYRNVDLSWYAKRFLVAAGMSEEKVADVEAVLCSDGQADAGEAEPEAETAEEQPEAAGEESQAAEDLPKAG